MNQTIFLVTLVGTALVLAAAFSSLIAFRFGAPLLLLFLGLGLVAGTDGLGSHHVILNDGPQDLSLACIQHRNHQRLSGG